MNIEKEKEFVSISSTFSLFVGSAPPVLEMYTVRRACTRQLSVKSVWCLCVIVTFGQSQTGKTKKNSVNYNLCVCVCDCFCIFLAILFHVPLSVSFIPFALFNWFFFCSFADTFSLALSLVVCVCMFRDWKFLTGQETETRVTGKNFSIHFARSSILAEGFSGIIMKRLEKSFLFSRSLWFHFASFFRVRCVGKGMPEQGREKAREK